MKPPAGFSVSTPGRWWRDRWFWTGQSLFYLFLSGAVRRCAGHVLVDLPTLADILLGQFEQFARFVGMAFGQHGIAGFVVDVILQLDGGGARIELERILSFGGQ